MIRIGNGYDVHRLEDGLPFTLGGIRIEHSKGEVAHSDGDCLIHALCDALLGALALGDIGKFFPDTSNEFAGIDSKILLRRTYSLIEERGFRLINADMIVALQRPKLRPYIDTMRETIASVLGVSADSISIKATTTEGLGFEGKEEGVSAYAVVLLEKVEG